MAYTPEQKAQAIVVAAFSSDREAADELDVSRRSIQRWRADMESDPELAENVATLYRDEIEGADWLEDATRTVQTAFSFLRQAANELDPADPDAVLAVSRAIQTITEAKLAADVINARLAEQGSKRRETDREDVAGYIGNG
jgi:hypothetical protein